MSEPVSSLCSPAPASPRVCAIVNPRAGGWKRLRTSDALAEPGAMVARWLREAGVDEASVKIMAGARDGTRLTREALAEGCTRIVAVGGDGTINDVVQGLCGDHDRAQATLGLIPMGTANVLARIFQLPLHDPAHAARIVRGDCVQTVDLGRMGAQWFALVAGVGFDAAVTRAIDYGFKRRYGEWAYVASALRQAVSYPRQAITLRVDDGEPQTFPAYLLLVANGNRYAGRFQLGPRVRMDDGLLDVFVCLRRASLAAALLRHTFALSQDRLAESAGVQHFQARRVSISSEGPLPVQLDGDAAGETPATIETVANALQVLVPGEAQPRG